MRLSTLLLVLPLLLISSQAVAQRESNRVVPTVITNHYDKSEPSSHGVAHVLNKEQRIKVEVKDLAKNANYDVALLDETSGKRVNVGRVYSVRRTLPSADAMVFPAFGIVGSTVEPEWIHHCGDHRANQLSYIKTSIATHGVSGRNPFPDRTVNIVARQKRRRGNHFFNHKPLTRLFFSHLDSPSKKDYIPSEVPPHHPP